MRTLKCYDRTIALVWKLSRIHQVNFSPDLGAWLRVIIKLLYSKKRSRKISEETLHPAELNGQTCWAPQSPTTSFRSVLGLVAQSYPTLCDPMDCVPPGSSILGDSPGKNTGVGFHVLLQGIFLTQGSNPCLLHCRRILYHLSHRGSPHCNKLDSLLLQAWLRVTWTKEGHDDVSNADWCSAHSHKFRLKSQNNSVLLPMVNTTTLPPNFSIPGTM